jgi:hypothetical protein
MTMVIELSMHFSDNRYINLRITKLLDAKSVFPTSRTSSTCLGSFERVHKLIFHVVYMHA